jgi:high affinity sulfate transporter 1
MFQGILPWDSARLMPDILAGITLATLGIPEVMGYTKIIGTPVITGLYTLLLPVLAFAIFGSSRHLVVGADSATAAMVAAGLASLSIAANDPKYVAMTSLVALVSAAMLLLSRILRLGFLADFLSRTVLVGFLSGVGVQVALRELHSMLGIDKGGSGFVGQLLFTFRHLPETKLSTMLIALAVLAVIVVSERLAPRFPGALLAVVGTIVASAFFHWGDHGIAVIGTVPGGLPHLGLPDVTWSDAQSVIPLAFSCFIVILAQSAATSQAYAMRYRDRYSENVDLVGLSFANALAGCSSTFIVNGSPTKTAMLDEAGGRSQVSHLTTAVVVLLVLLFLTRPLSFLPEAVLASIVFVIGVKLVDYRGLQDIYRKKPREFVVASVAAATVILIGVREGIIVAVVLSLLEHVRRSYRPGMGVVVGGLPDHWRISAAVPGKMIEPGLVLFWFGSDLFYANAQRFTETAQRLVTESPSPVRWLVIDASAITGIDYTAGRALADLQKDLAKANVVLAMARVQPGFHLSLKHMGLTKLIGNNRIFDSRQACIEAYLAEVQPAPGGPKDNQG